MSTRRYCKHCHKCGAELKSCLDGEEYCPNCHQYKRYLSHGWSSAIAEGDYHCPDIAIVQDCNKENGMFSHAILRKCNRHICDNISNKERIKSND